ncbi:hypothetical protein ACFZAU_24915 [Streptomyces sp. NPDC008238]
MDGDYSGCPLQSDGRPTLLARLRADGGDVAAADRIGALAAAPA